MSANDKASPAPATMIDEELLDAGLTLINAAANLDADEVGRLLKEDAPVWFQDELGWSALHYAAEREDSAMVKTLLANGAVWNAVDNQGNTAACVALSLNAPRIYGLITSHGIRSEFLLSFMGDRSDENGSTLVLKDAEEDTLAGNTDLFLKSKLTYETDVNGQARVLDEEGNGVMMGWETGVRLCFISPVLRPGLTHRWTHRSWRRPSPA